jgi:hypothetical protein
MKPTRVVLPVILATAVLAGCAVADPDTSQAVLHYSGGPFSSQNFQDCITPGTRQVDGYGDYHYYYPNGRRTFDFTGGPGSESPPLKVSTKNENGTTEVSVRGVVTFSLNTSCEPWKDADGREWPGGIFQSFHDNVGRHLAAFSTNGGEQQPPAWTDAVRLYVGGPTEKALDNEGLSFDWQHLINSADDKNALQDRVFKLLPALIEKQAGGPYFIVHNVQIQSIDAPDSLKAAQDQAQAAKLRQQTTAIDEQTATNFPGGVTAYADYQVKLAIIKALNEGRGVPVPFGSSAIIQPR